MKSSLSKRERILILVAAYIGIGYLLFQFAILPTYTAYQKKQEQSQLLSIEKTMIDTKIASEASIISQNEASHATLDQIKAVYPPVMRNEQIDNILTGLCVSNGLTPISLSLSAEEREEEQPQEQSEDAEGEQPQERSVFVTVNAQMTATGSIGQLLRLLNGVAPMEHISISRLSFQSRTDLTSYDDCRITLYFAVTMMREIQ